MELTKKETYYIKFCDYFLMAKLFKKYWIVGGSYWNKIHTDKNNINHLTKIIEQSYIYTKIHLYGILFELPIHLYIIIIIMIYMDCIL